MDCYLFNIDGDKLEITGSNTEVFLTTSVEIVGDGFTKSIAIPSTKLANLVRSLPECPIQFTIEEKEIAGKATFFVKIKAGNGNYSLPAEDGSDYPTLKEGEQTTFDIKTSDLLTGINKTLYSCTIAGKEPYGGLNLEFADGLVTFTGTNGHTISTFNAPVDIDSLKSFVVPVKTMAILQTLPFEETVKISVCDNNIKFQVNEDTILRSVLIDFKFPDYQNVIPVQNPNVLSIDRQELLASIKRVTQFANHVTYSVLLKICGDKFSLTGEDTDYAQEAIEELAHVYQGTDLTIALNGTDLTNSLSKFTTDDVHLYFNTYNKPILIKDSQVEVIDKTNLILIRPIYTTN